MVIWTSSRLRHPPGSLTATRNVTTPPRFRAPLTEPETVGPEGGEGDARAAGTPANRATSRAEDNAIAFGSDRHDRGKWAARGMAPEWWGMAPTRGKGLTSEAKVGPVSGSVRPWPRSGSGPPPAGRTPWAASC